MRQQLRFVSDKIDKKSKGITNSLSSYEGIIPDAPNNSFKQKKGTYTDRDHYYHTCVTMRWWVSDDGDDDDDVDHDDDDHEDEEEEFCRCCNIVHDIIAIIPL